LELAAFESVGGTGTVAVLGDVDGLLPDAAGADGGSRGAGDPVAVRASKAFNAIALLYQL